MTASRLVLMVTLMLGLLAAPIAAEAQPAGKVPRIAFLWAGLPGVQAEPLEGLRPRLRELGYVEGQTIVIEARYAENKLERLPALVAELVRLKVDVILALGGQIVRAAKAGSPDPAATSPG